MEKTKQTLIVTYEVHVELVKYLWERESFTIPELVETAIEDHKTVTAVIRGTSSFVPSSREQLARTYGNLFSLPLPEVLALVTTRDYEVQRPIDNIKKNIAAEFSLKRTPLETLLDKYVDELKANKHIKEDE
ncbi:hypothetical protein [Bacillus phage phiAGATE]|uniref:Uncharacterized protein n=1 Tax=Bacillus phage phiAGATE TaxID=1204533 RepID=L0L8E7_9CAUD|nr:hypothetical protein G380_gp029 [Bacillus phage phiAGATE]AGB62679.1 hypothetical protein [Bacillus phage phiAGATE]